MTLLIADSCISSSGRGRGSRYSSHARNDEMSGQSAKLRDIIHVGQRQPGTSCCDRAVAVEETIVASLFASVAFASSFCAHGSSNVRASMTAAGRSPLPAPPSAPSLSPAKRDDAGGILKRRPAPAWHIPGSSRAAYARGGHGRKFAAGERSPSFLPSAAQRFAPSCACSAATYRATSPFEIGAGSVISICRHHRRP